MILNTKNGSISIDGTSMPYIRFGSGSRTLIMLPGLGDGLKSVQGMALPMAIMYRMFAREYTVFMFSRREILPEGFTTRDMARDVISAMDELNIASADVVGVSMGGMIAQYIAIDHPERINRLVLAVSASKASVVGTEVISQWIAMAEQGDHAALMEDNLRLIYTDRYYRRMKPLIPLAARFTKPKSYAKFLTMARACLTHDARASLPQITAPTLVIGGMQDHVLGGSSSPELSALIPGAQLHMYEHLGHSAYEEAPDFNHIVLDFLKEKGANI